MPFPWPPASATGVGPLPGDDPLAAARLVFDVLASFPFVPSMPDAGVGHDFAARGAALLVDLHVDLQPSGWRLVPRPGRDERRARDARSRTLDAIEAAADGWSGVLKVPVPGPWSLAASIELSRGEKVLADEGAVRDLAGSLAEGVRDHVAAVRRVAPGVTEVVVEVHEPWLAPVLAGAVPTQSGWARHPAVDTPAASDVLGTVVAAGGPATGVRCGAGPVPVAMLHRAGARFVAFDVASPFDEDELGEALEAGVGLHVGLVPASGGEVRALAEPAERLFTRLGLGSDVLTDAFVVTPRDGLEQAAVSAVAPVLRRCLDVAEALAEIRS